MKKIISMFLVFVMVLSLGSFSVFADGQGFEIVDETNKILKITSENGWDAVVDAGSYTDWTIEVCSDVTANKPFGTFTGTLVGNKDGGKPTITNNINSGLISTLATGTVKDLIIAGSITVEEGSYCGSLVDKICDTTTASNILISGIENNCSVTLQSGGGAGMIGRLAYNTRSAGNAYTVTIIDCVNNAAMSTSGAYCGGIIGALNAPTKAIEGDKITVENCDNYGTISGKEYVGGIIGGYATAHNAKYIFEGCSNYGRITGTGNSVGGIAGALFGVMDTIKKCANYAQVTSSGNNVAGIVGYDVNVNISETFNNGAISGANYAGGITGRIGVKNGENPTVIISDCYNSGSITASGHAAGIMSYSTNDNNKIKKLNLTNIYNVGNVSLTGTKTTYYIINAKIALADGASAEVGNIYYLEGLKGSDTYPVSGGSYSTLVANTKAGFEKLPNGFSADTWVSLEGGYPILKNNLPTNADGTTITYHAVTLENGENGTAYKDEVTYVEHGTPYTLTVIPDEGYEIDEITNLIAMGDNKYQTEAITGDVTVSVTFKEIELPQEGVAGATDAFYSDAFELEGQQVDSYNIVHFARFTVKDGVNAIYGIEISQDNFATVLNQGLASSNYNGQYGVRFYGTKIIKGNTYFLRPYVSYDNGETYSYGNIITYTTPIEN